MPDLLVQKEKNIIFEMIAFLGLDGIYMEGKFESRLEFDSFKTGYGIVMCFIPAIN